MFVDGRGADAAEALDKLLGEGLDDKEMIKATDKLSPEVRQQLVLDPVTAEPARKLIERVGKAVSNLRRDQAYIDQVAGTLSGDASERGQAVQRCRQLGEYAVPALVKVLAQAQEADLRVAVGNTLVLMGPRAVRPLAEAVHISEPTAAA